LARPTAGPEPLGSADRDRAACSALQLAGKGIGLLGRDEPLALDRLAATAEVLDGAGHGATFGGAWGVAVDGEQAQLADGTLGCGHDGGGEGPQKAARARSAGQGRGATRVSPGQREHLVQPGGPLAAAAMAPHRPWWRQHNSPRGIPGGQWDRDLRRE
jgi:hypothetical protein